MFYMQFLILIIGIKRQKIKRFHKNVLHYTKSEYFRKQKTGVKKTPALAYKKKNVGVVGDHRHLRIKKECRRRRR